MGKKELTKEQKEILGIKDEEVKPTPVVAETVINEGTQDNSSDTPAEAAEVVEQQQQEEQQQEQVEELPPVPEVVVVEEVIEATVAAPVVLEATAKESVVKSMVRNTIENYLKVMAPRAPVTKAIINQQQVVLYRALVAAIENVNNDFEEVFTYLLEQFNANATGAFHETRIFRGIEDLTLQADEIKAFQRIINLLKVTANPKSRAIAIKQVDVNNSLAFGVSDHGRRMVMNYFNV